MKQRYERIEKLINKHNRSYIGIYTNKDLNVCLSTIFYGKCLVYFSEYTNTWYLDFYINNQIINSLKLDVVDYDMINHALYIK